MQMFYIKKEIVTTWLNLIVYMAKIQLPLLIILKGVFVGVDVIWFEFKTILQHYIRIGLV